MLGMDGDRRPRGRLLRVAMSVGLAAVLGGVVLSACSSSGSGANAITLYNGQHPQTTQKLVSAFEQSTGVTVNVRNGDEDALANQIVTEGSNSPADVFFTENSPPLEYLQGKGLLQPVDSATLAETPTQYNSPKGDWVGVSARVSVIVYNPSLISPADLPSSVLDLADPKYSGKLGLAPSETDFQPIVTSVDRQEGKAATERWLDGLKSNASSHTYPDNETLVNQVNRGAVAMAVINQYYWYRLQAELGASGMHSKIVYFAPHDPGYVVNVSGAGVLKSSSHKSEAQKFLAFLVSHQGQEIIAHSDSFEYPLAAGVTTAAAETPFDQLQPIPIDVAELGDGSTAVALLREAGLL
jgi:iron(III) transport system substrate-binding protein